MPVLHFGVATTPALRSHRAWISLGNFVVHGGIVKEGKKVEFLLNTSGSAWISLPICFDFFFSYIYMWLKKKCKLLLWYLQVSTSFIF